MELEAGAVGLLIALFSRPGSALLLAMGIFAFAMAVLAVTWWSRVRPMSAALMKRLEALSVAGSAAPASLARGFASRLEQVDLAMMSRSPSVPQLPQSWMEYRQTFVELEEDVISASSHADDYFQGAGAPGRTLEWWANIFVAIGLLFTFLGIVAALSQATRAIQAGASADAMQAALSQLLDIAAAKFWTSVAGIAASLVLRIVGRGWRDRLEAEEDELCETLDACVAHISPQSVSLLQLRELRRLADALDRAGAGNPARAAEPRSVAHV